MDLMMRNLTFNRHKFWWMVGMLVAAMTYCTASAQTNALQVGITIPGFPHKIDVYRPAGATKALVFLHGHGGRASLSAYELGFQKKQYTPTAKNVVWDWLSANGVIAVFPQGQGYPLPTWNNYVFRSGQDDVAFLGALSAHLKTTYGATEVTLAGHSAGGVMTGRMWCEGTTSFKAFVSVAGPMVSSAYPVPGQTCTPLAPTPYYMIVGGSDTKLTKFAGGITTPTPAQIAAGLTDTILVSEWLRHQDRSQSVCGTTPALESSVAAPSGSTWDSCSAHIRYTLVTNADHPIPSLEQHYGVRMADVIARFAGQPP